MFSDALTAHAQKLLKSCEGKGWKLASAESCTGGLIAALFTEIPGSSRVFDRGFVTYSNEAKAQMLGVPATLIKKQGAVSAQVAEAMAEGALRHSDADLSVAVTGIAGPGGGSAAKPVGLVYIATAKHKGDTQVVECRFKGTRSAIREAAVRKALLLLKERLSRSS